MTDSDHKTRVSSIRRANRTAVVQFLYMWSINPGEHLSYSLNQFFENQEHPRDYYAFAEELIHGCLKHLATIDSKISDYAQNWKFDRIAKVDLAILRLAIFEMLFRTDIPPIVSINEAIELTKLLSHEDAKRFVNGILDKLKKELNRPLREASES